MTDRLLDRALRASLRLYPANIRDAQGAGMRQTFLESVIALARDKRVLKIRKA